MWLCKNACQLCPRGGVGFRRSRMYRCTVRFATWIPSLSSSPRIRSAPQSRFSATMRRISSTRSGDTRGVGDIVDRDFQRQSKRNPSRCQRSTVSGFTSSSASRHLGSTAASSVIRVRSCRWKAGFFTFLAATMSCCRRRAFSATSSERERSKSAASPATTEHGRGRSASRTAFAARAKTVCNWAMTPASTKPICAETSYIFKLLPGVKSSTILCRRSEGRGRDGPLLTGSGRPPHGSQRAALPYRMWLTTYSA